MLLISCIYGGSVGSRGYGNTVVYVNDENTNIKGK